MFDKLKYGENYKQNRNLKEKIMIIKKTIISLISLLLFLSIHTYGLDKKKYKLGIYAETPITNGFILEKKLDKNHFFSIKYGIAPEYYMNMLGSGLENFDWWNSIYSNLLTEICTGMQGGEVSFGTTNFLNKKNLTASFGVSLYNVDYNSYGNELFNAAFGTSLDKERPLEIKAKLVALNFNISKIHNLKKNWELTTGFNIKYINSFYGTVYSDIAINDELSYSLNNWLADYLENLFLPTLSLQIKYKFK